MTQATKRLQVVMQEYKPAVLELAASKASLENIVSLLDDTFDEGNI